ncbi:propanediol dehydratase [Salmonella enterica subsp. enterica]|nr:propanediol dehydratase [Salmonella enterica subsp. enterica]
MDSNHSAPAIVITVINDCASPGHEVLLGIEEEGILSASLITRLEMSPTAPAVARRAARRCWSALLAIDTAGRALQEFTRIGAALRADASSDSQAHRTGNNAARLVKGSFPGSSINRLRRTAGE